MISVGLAAAAYHDDGEFNTWLRKRSNLTASKMEHFKRASVEELVFIFELSRLTHMGFIHLVISLNIKSWGLSYWVKLITYHFHTFPETWIGITSHHFQ